MDSMRDPFTDLDINCKSQLALLECCREVNPGLSVVFASTRQIYGRPDYLPVDEKHPGPPHGCQRHQQNGRRMVSHSV